MTKMSTATGTNPISKLAIGMVVTDVTSVSVLPLKFSSRNRPTGFNQAPTIGPPSLRRIYGLWSRGVEYLAR